MRLIDADALIDEIKHKLWDWESVDGITATTVLKQTITDIENQPVALLKEQEAELSFREAKAITHTATKLDDATCPSCGNVVGEKIRTGAIGQSVVQVRWDYCRFCGQKLDWEGR